MFQIAQLSHENRHYPTPEHVRRMTGYNPTPATARRRERANGDVQDPSRNNNNNNNASQEESDSSLVPPSVISVDTTTENYYTSKLSIGDLAFGDPSEEMMDQQQVNDEATDPRLAEMDTFKQQVAASLDPRQVKMKRRRRRVQTASTVVGGAVGGLVLGPVGAVVVAAGGYAVAKAVGNHQKRKQQLSEGKKAKAVIENGEMNPDNPSFSRLWNSEEEAPSRAYFEV